MVIFLYCYVLYVMIDCIGDFYGGFMWLVLDSLGMR